MAILYQDFLVLPNLCKFPRPQEEWPMILEAVPEKLGSQSVPKTARQVIVNIPFNYTNIQQVYNKIVQHLHVHRKKTTLGPSILSFFCVSEVLALNIHVRPMTLTRDCP